MNRILLPFPFVEVAIWDIKHYMAEARHLRHAPITEAIIDFRVKAAADFNVKDFATAKTAVEKRLPKMEEQGSFQAKIEIAKGKPPRQTVSDAGIRGYRFSASDGKTLAQFRIDGFTVNRLRPYTSWEELFPQAMELWALYCGIAKPVTVTRLALRYINRIELTGIKIDFDRYLTAAPRIPPAIPQSVSGFLTRVTIQGSDEIAAHVAQALEKNAETGQPTVIVDIDAFKNGQFARDDPSIPVVFGQLRDFKNLIFFNYLTEETLKGFE